VAADLYNIHRIQFLMLANQTVFEFGFLNTSAIDSFRKLDFQQMGTLSPMLLQQNKFQKITLENHK
jgi:hypothetical protein